MDSTFFFIFLKIIECYIAGQKTEGKGEVFLIILFLKSLLSGLIIFLFVEEFSVFVQIYLYLLLINILLITVLSLTGAKSKIRMPLLKFGNKIKLFSSVKGYNYQVDDINNHLPLNTRKNNNNELTDRELQVLGFICEGMTSKEIADKLFLSKKTIDHYRMVIKQKLHIQKKSEMVKYYDNNFFISHNYIPK